MQYRAADLWCCSIGGPLVVGLDVIGVSGEQASGLSRNSLRANVVLPSPVDTQN